MAILSTTTILIKGKKLHHFNKLNLNQEIGEHHSLELSCSLSEIQDFCNYIEIEIEELLGEILTIEISSSIKTNYYKEFKFKGIITGIKFRKGLYSGDGDYLIIQGKSPTILAEDGPHYTSYNEMSFVDIIEQTFSNYDTSKLNVDIKNSNLSESLLYTVHYKESCFGFAQRLASRYGEWMYYNGETLVFGLDTNSDEDEELQLFLGRDLIDFNTTLIPIAQNFNYYTNDYHNNDIHQNESSASDSSDGILGVVNESSNNIYPNQTQLWLNISDDENSRNRLDNLAQLQQNAIQTNQIVVSGNSDNPGVTIGKQIKINQTNYRVTKVSHKCTSHGEYENYFEATIASNTAYPKTNVFAFPIAQSQTAIVTENHDPDGLGRIKVQFAWQREQGLATPWIRMVSLHAGSGKGFYCIPELDEEVLVGFEGGNAETPYVMGCLYNAISKPPGDSSTANNDITIIMTRSGLCLNFNDNTNTLTITNRFTCDENNTQITLKGDGTIIINAELDVNITAEGSISLDAPTINIGSESATPDLTNIHGKTIHIHASELLELLSDLDLKANGTNVEVIASTIAKLQGATTTVQGSALTEIKGGQVKLN